MKILLYSTFGLLLFNCSANNRNDFRENNLVRFEYLNSIHGYKIEAYWTPSKVSYQHIVGAAIIDFYNIEDSTSFTLTTNNFSVLKDRLAFRYNSDSTQIEELKSTVQLTYKKDVTATSKGFGTSREPFFFKDIDFDNKDELLIAEVANGQRGTTSYKVYKLEYGDVTPELYQITNEEPYKSLDEISQVDYSNKRIMIYSSNGACAGIYSYYKRTAKDDYSDNPFSLEYVVEEQSDNESDKCYEATYVIGQTKQLISKKIKW